MKKINFCKNIIHVDYGDKKIIYDFFSSNSDVLIVFFHGCCGSAYDKTGSTYQQLCELLYPEFDCALYESSRFIRKIDLPQNYDFNNFAAEAFKGKNFEDEIHDADVFLNHILKEKQYSKVIFVGFSMGGLVASLLSRKYKVSAIFLFGSASYFNLEKNIPILGNLKERDRVRNILKSELKHVNTNIFMIRGSLDDTAQQKYFEELSGFFPKSKIIKKQTWDGVDHRFKLRDNNIDQNLIIEIIEYIKKEML